MTHIPDEVFEEIEWREGMRRSPPASVLARIPCCENCKYKDDDKTGPLCEFCRYNPRLDNFFQMIEPTPAATTTAGGSSGLESPKE